MPIGRVIKSTGSWYDVQDDAGTIVQCRLRGRIRLDGIRTTNPVAVGDMVNFEREQDKDTCVIDKILPRNNVIVRKSVNLSKESHIIAANVDRAVVVATVAYPRTSTGFIDRFAVTAEAYHIPVVVVFNKCDLYDDEQNAFADELIATYQNIGYQSFKVSAKTGYNCDMLESVMKDKITMLSGHSGVGKSALVNRLEICVSGRYLMPMRKVSILQRMHRCSIFVLEAISLILLALKSSPFTIWKKTPSHNASLKCAP